MKTEIDRICGIMYTLLEHQPVIDVPYEKINDIAVALVKEGYGKISEYEAEKEMLGSKIKALEQRLNNKYIEVDNLNRDYHNSFERLKAQEREIERLKAENCELTKKLEARLTCDFVKTAQKQAQIDILNKANERLNVVSREFGDDCDLCGVSAVCSCRCEINKLIEEINNDKRRC